VRREGKGLASRAASTGNRNVIAAAGVVMQVALGAVYAWSVFQIPLEEHFGASSSSIKLTFSITILALGFAAFFGGLWMRSVGPRVVAIAAGILYGGGVLLASLSSGSLFLLYITYGLIGGIGIGLGYIVPIATLIKWFPDKRGFITGVAVAGFGAGALVTTIIARVILAAGVGVFPTFAILGVIYLVAVVAAGSFMKNPPQGWSPGGTRVQQAGAGSGEEYEIRGALRTWQWYALWALLFLNVTAGIAIISEASPMAQEITGVGPNVAAGLVIIISIANAAGRFLWAWFSDAIGRKWVFFTMFVLQAVLFLLLPVIGVYFLLAVVSFIIVSCYGGGFGTMPSFAADYFGSRDVGTIYGLMLTAWGVGGVLGPLLISSIIDSTQSYTLAFYIIAAIMIGSAVFTFFVNPPKRGASAVSGQPAGARVR
jgi:OFA family oxalate/formate antiporter-like MFS transporter